MNTKDAPKRKYKKHKQGFKIAVDYKLYVRNGEKEYEPLYMEVRAKNQNTLIKSRFQCNIKPCDFNKLFSNEVIAHCLQLEKDLIVDSIKREVEKEGKNFSMKFWYNKYSLSSDRVYFTEIYEDFLHDYFIRVAGEKGVDYKTIIGNLSDLKHRWEILKYIRLLYEFGVEEFKAPLDLLESVLNFQSNSTDYLIHQQEFTDFGYFSIASSFVKSDKDNGLFAYVYSKLSDNQNVTPEILSQAKQIEDLFVKNIVL